MQRMCAKHPYEKSDNLCRSCGQEFCVDCLVYPNGPKKLPLCLACAVAEGGLRSTARPRRKLTRREVRRRVRARQVDAQRHADETPAVFDEPLAGVRPFSEDTLPDWYALLEELPAADEPEPAPAFEGEPEPGVVIPFLRALAADPPLEREPAPLDRFPLQPGHNPFAIESDAPGAPAATVTPVTAVTPPEAAADERPTLPTRTRTSGPGPRLAGATRTARDFSADPFAAGAFDASPFGPAEGDGNGNGNGNGEGEGEGDEGPRPGGRLRQS